MTTLPPRIGIGHDRHRLGEGGPLLVGGVEVEHDHHAIGHSDADVLLHAVTDAILGAAAMGDIGEMFPDTDEANRDRDSADMLARAVGRVSDLGYAVGNLDCIIFAQRPKLSPHKQAISHRLAEIVGIDPSQINVKAKTGEGSGPIGKEEVIEAQAVVILVKAK